MFLVDISPPMGTLKTVELPGPNGETVTKTVTHLEYALQFVKLKVQEMVWTFVAETRETRAKPFCIQIFNGRKTDQCGVITFGSEGGFLERNAHFEWVLTSLIRDGQHCQRQERWLRKCPRVHLNSATQW